MRLSRGGVWAMVIGVALCGAGCGLQKQAPKARVLKTEEFVSDPVTVPTDVEPQAGPVVATAPPPAPPVISAAAAREGILEVTAKVGKPEEVGAAPKAAEPPLTVDAKIGEMNGRPVRVDEVLDEVGPRLSERARAKRFSRDEWGVILKREPPKDIENQPITREDWLRFTEDLMTAWLDLKLEDQLLAEEARASLKPEQKQGLKYFVEQAVQEERRKAGGSEAEFQRRLREESLTQRDFERVRESKLLIEYEISEKLRKRVNTNWKDVRLFYERNYKDFNPPPIARFRMIQVPLDKAGEVAEVQSLLDRGEPFAKVAGMDLNGYGPREGGRVPDRTYEGDFDQAKFFPDPLNGAVAKLHPGEFTNPPVDFGTRKTWVFLDSIEKRSQPLSDPDVQLSIATRLNNAAFRDAKKAYIDRLKSRATYTDIKVMAARLTEIAGQRYWPKE